MDKQLRLRIILENPPKGVDFGLQLGSGNKFEVVQKQRSGVGNLVFTLEVVVRNSKNGLPDFFGPYVQGPNTERFIYLDIGTIAGQFDSEWSRRLKIPLRNILWGDVDKVTSSNDMIPVETLVPGTARDGGPTVLQLNLLQAGV